MRVLKINLIALAALALLSPLSILPADAAPSADGKDKKAQSVLPENIRDGAIVCAAIITGLAVFFGTGKSIKYQEEIEMSQSKSTPDKKK